MPSEHYLTDHEAAEYLGVSVHTLRNFRRKGYRSESGPGTTLQLRPSKVTRRMSAEGPTNAVKWLFI